MTALAPSVTPDPDRIANAAQSVPGVARLHGGRFGEVATYLPGRRVTGVQVGTERISIHVVARWGRSLPALAEAVRMVVRPLAPGFPIDVTIEDLDVVDGGADSAPPEDRTAAGVS